MAERACTAGAGAGAAGAIDAARDSAPDGEGDWTGATGAGGWAAVATGAGAAGAEAPPPVHPGGPPTGICAKRGARSSSCTMPPSAYRRGGNPNPAWPVDGSEPSRCDAVWKPPATGAGTAEGGGGGGAASFACAARRSGLSMMELAVTCALRWALRSAQPMGAAGAGAGAAGAVEAITDAAGAAAGAGDAAGAGEEADGRVLTVPAPAWPLIETLPPTLPPL